VPTGAETERNHRRRGGSEGNSENSYKLTEPGKLYNGKKTFDGIAEGVSGKPRGLLPRIPKVRKRWDAGAGNVEAHVERNKKDIEENFTPE